MEILYFLCTLFMYVYFLISVSPCLGRDGSSSAVTCNRERLDELGWMDSIYYNM